MTSLRNTQPGSARSIRVRRASRSIRRPDFTPTNQKEAELKIQKIRNEFEGRVKHSPGEASLWIRYANFEAANHTGKVLGILERARKAAPCPQVYIELLKHNKDPQQAARILEQYPNSEEVRKFCLSYLSIEQARAKLAQWCREEPKYFEKLIALENKCENTSTVCNLYNLWATKMETDANLWFRATEYVRSHGTRETWFAMCANALNFLFFSKPNPAPSDRKFLANNFLRYCDWSREDQEGLVEQLLQLELDPYEEALFIKHAHRCRMRAKDINPITACKNISTHILKTRTKTVSLDKMFDRFDCDALGFYFEDILAKPNQDCTSREYYAAARDVAAYATWRKNDRFLARVVKIYGQSRDIVTAYIRSIIYREGQLPIKELDEAFEQHSDQVMLDRLASSGRVVRSPNQFRSLFYKHLARSSTRVYSWIGVLRLEESCGNIETCRQLYELALEQVEVWDGASWEITSRTGWDELWLGYLNLENKHGTAMAYRNLLVRWAQFDQGRSNIFWDKALTELNKDHGIDGGTFGINVLERLTDGEVTCSKPGRFAKFLR